MRSRSAQSPELNRLARALAEAMRAHCFARLRRDPCKINVIADAPLRQFGPARKPFPQRLASAPRT
eukprot:10006514-Alexandrium_andersonii.AAC.1